MNNHPTSAPSLLGVFNSLGMAVFIAAMGAMTALFGVNLIQRQGVMLFGWGFILIGGGMVAIGLFMAYLAGLEWRQLATARRYVPSQLNSCSMQEQNETRH